MRFDPQERLAKSNKTSDVQNRIWRELVKLHAVNEENPTEKFMAGKDKPSKRKARNFTR
jgi:hypothetical protein